MVIDIAVMSVVIMHGLGAFVEPAADMRLPLVLACSTANGSKRIVAV
jgi:hypothetical protein